jgi:acyl dehydratase
MSKKAIFYEDIKVGDEIPNLTKRITLVQQVMYAAATWDFHRHHYDKDFAQERGFPAPFTDSQLFGAYLAQLITDWIGLNGRLKKLRLEHRVLVFTGDTVTCGGKVVDKYTKDGENLISCCLWVHNQKGENVAPASALITVASKP